MSMRQFLLIFLGVFLFSFSCIFSQSKFGETNNNSSEPAQEPISSIIALKSKLPCNYFSNISSSFIGVSDVGVDSITAREQAYLRAMSMIALRNGLVRGMSDFFNDTNGNQISSNYEELCELKAYCNLPVTGLKVSDSIWLKSGELVLFVTVDSTNERRFERVSLNSSISIYYKENESDGSRKIINKISIENKLFYPCRETGHTEKLTYIVGNNRWLSKETFFDDRKIGSDRYKIFYETLAGCAIDSTGCKEAGSNAVDGLWYAMINNLYRQLSAQLKEQFVKVKKVGDKYQDKLISLNRESGYFKFGCVLLDGALVDNKLVTRIKTEFPTTK